VLYWTAVIGIDFVFSSEEKRLELWILSGWSWFVGLGLSFEHRLLFDPGLLVC
jgi:hypothetical protein